MTQRLWIAFLLCSLGGCGDDTYGAPCAMDSDCRTGVRCWCEDMDEAGECPGETGTCLSPTDYVARTGN